MASQDGTDFEQEVAEKLDGYLVPGSGNGAFRKMDVETSVWGEHFLISCKSTEQDGVRINHKLFEEVENHAREKNPDLIPLMCMEIDSLANSRQFVVLSLDEFERLATAGAEGTITPTVAQTRHQQSQVPPLLR